MKKRNKHTNGKPTPTNGEHKLTDEESALLRDADLAVGRLKVALANNMLQERAVLAERAKILEAIDAAQANLNAKGSEVAQRVRKSPDERWVVDLGRMVLQRA